MNRITIVVMAITFISFFIGAVYGMQIGRQKTIEEIEEFLKVSNCCLDKMEEK